MPASPLLEIAMAIPRRRFLTWPPSPAHRWGAITPSKSTNLEVVKRLVCRTDTPGQRVPGVHTLKHNGYLHVAGALFQKPEVRTSHTTFRYVVVIPAYNEGTGIARPLSSLLPAPLGDALIIVVINSATPLEGNKVSLEYIRKNYPEIATHEMLALNAHPAGQILIVNANGAFSEPSVGMARGLGCALAIGLMADGIVENRWIHCTDADASLPVDYLTRPEEVAAQKGESYGRGALVFPYWHTLGPNPRDLIDHETHLRYYTLGLRSAGSAYAHYSIGSTIVIRPQSYLKAGGFSERAAGEDFYLLNRARTNGPIEQLPGVPLLLSGRVSTRTPFGTGQSLVDTTTIRTTYNPEVFDYLGMLLKCLEHAVQSPCTLAQALYRAKVPSIIRVAAEERGWLELHERMCRQKHGTENRQRQALQAFDGLRTLRLIHWFRDNALPNVPVAEAIARARFTPLLCATTSINRRRLFKAEANRDAHI